MRPEAITIFGVDEALPEDHVPLPATVETVERLGNISYGYLDVGMDEPITAQIMGETELRNGDAVLLGMPRDTLYIFNSSGLSVTDLS